MILHTSVPYILVCLCECFFVVFWIIVRECHIGIKINGIIDFSARSFGNMASCMHQEFYIFLSQFSVKQRARIKVLVCQTTVLLMTAPSSETIVLLRTTQQFMLFGFLIYVPNPLCTELTLPKPQTLMLCCNVPTSQAVSCCSSHSGYSSLLPELGMHPVFLSKHQNKM